MSILGEHPQVVSEKSLKYLLSLTDDEKTNMTTLSAMTVIHQLMIHDPHGDIRTTFLQNGILERILSDFDTGFHTLEKSVFLEISLNILWNLSKLAVCPVQPLISDSVIRRLISMFDITTPFYSYSRDCSIKMKDICENKHLVGHISSCLVSVQMKEDIRSVTNGRFKTFKKFPEEIHLCSLYDTSDPENEVNVTSHLISNKVAWPLNHENEQLQTSETNDWKDILVTEVIGGPYFWAHMGIETIENVRRIQNLLLLEYSSGKLSAVSCVRGDIVVVSTDIDDEQCFLRGYVLSVKPQTIKVWAMDYGFIIEVTYNNVYSVPPSLVDLPEQIHLCCIRGIQPRPRDSLMVKLAASVLCNLTCKSRSAGDMIIKHGGLECINNFISACHDHSLLQEVLHLVTNMSFTEKGRKQFVETEIIPILLEKLACLDNKPIYPDLLHCLSNLIFHCNAARDKFYHNQGIDVVLKVIITYEGLMDKACIQVLKSFLQIGDSAERSKPLKTEVGRTTPRSNSCPKEIDKLTAQLEETELLKGEIHYSLSDDRLNHNMTCDDPDLRECDNRFQPRSVGDIRDSVVCHVDSVPVNACSHSFDNKRIFVKDSKLDVQTDSLHELRPNKTLINVSSSVISTHVCGMLNSRKGGSIIFGISESSRVMGVKATRDDRDEFRLGVDRMMTDKFCPSVIHSLFDMEYFPVVEENFTGETSPIPDLYVIIIHVKPSKGQLYTLKVDDTSYIRFGPVTSPLSVQDLRNLVILEEEDRYRSQIIQLQHKLK